MKSFISVLLASTFLASTAFASLKTCGSPTNDIIYKSADYSPYPADPSKRVCFNIWGTVKAEIPTSSKAIISFSHNGLEGKYTQDFMLTLGRTESIPKDSKTPLQSCFYFPPAFQFKTNADISVRLEVAHSTVDSSSKRVLCLQGVVKT